eukprot:TRINITY_DN7017_c0_g1_i1.p1 TRINITY_DN7017_c0_g1~~TRINITY_DN7017_c0_g1_i1.p1  ORF type:complete len:240 (+),score=27.66 TRINITY_DN7017_c0_g1_i1:37-756(+)
MDARTTADSSQTTLFVSEVPSDIDEEGFIAIFSKAEGFSSARIREDRTDKTVGWVEFDDHESAAAAKEKFEGHKHNEDDVGLSIQWARQKRKSRPPRTDRATSRLVSYTGSVPSFAAPFTTPLPADANSTLYVEGLPADISERELSHIFRPYSGFQSIRLLPRSTVPSKSPPTKPFYLCFVEFDNKTQAHQARDNLQGYKLDLKLPNSRTNNLRISFAKIQKEKRRPPSKLSGIDELES